MGHRRGGRSGRAGTQGSVASSSRPLSATEVGFHPPRPRPAERRRADRGSLQKTAVEATAPQIPAGLTDRAGELRGAGQAAAAAGTHQGYEVVAGEKRDMIPASCEVTMTTTSEPITDTVLSRWETTTAGGVERSRRCRGEALALLGIPFPKAGRLSPRPRDGSISSTTTPGSCSGSDPRANPSTKI